MRTEEMGKEKGAKEKKKGCARPTPFLSPAEKKTKKKERKKKKKELGQQTNQ